MKNIVASLLAATLSVSFAAAAVPAAAARISQPQPSSANIQSVDYKPWMKHRNINRNRSFSENDGTYWNGHRGSRDYHRGYRRHGDYWFPLAAFATGALITGAIVNSENNRVYRGNPHVQWCYDRYRSYRASDNTFQPNYGPRQQCNSPY
ncbi:BA14K-like protein [Mesorhizobium sp. NFR06]|uniref:BA14K family protein n=1 Tax=Mesorhizobium sp. NFR06 TaxID=1566290 RepID=UPI0008ECE292|nr:BA14K family protein [Mesorhizobium sp. NFR06]SFO85374.1 BA14K-like protein [Mesorhizobium sp. NFR06]